LAPAAAPAVAPAPPPAPAEPPAAGAATPSPAPGTLAITVLGSDGRRREARVELDGALVAAAASAARIQIADAAEHRLQVTASGHAPFRRAVAAAPGTAADLVVKLDKIKPAPRKVGEDRGKDYMIDPFGSPR
jgi:hypothetical protein